jgi:hypothetical protein
MAISLNVSAPGAIPDLDTLKSTVSAHLDRDDLDTLLPQFILLAEAMFNRELRCPEMEQTDTVQVTSEDTPLPDDYLAMRAIYIEGNPDRPLRGMAPSAIRQEFDGTSGIPVAYTLVGGGLRLYPVPTTPGSLITMDYWARIVNLSTAAPSNWLLEKHPDAYLYGTLFQAEAYLDNATRASQWAQLLGNVIDRINRTSRNDRYGAGPLVPNHVVQVRGGRC